MIKEKYIVKSVRKTRIRNLLKHTLRGTPEKPRLIVIRTNKYLYVQVVDDLNHRVLTTASTLEKEMREKLKSAKNHEAAKALGEKLAERLQEKKIETVVFDRNYYPYTGRIKTLADAAREKGIRF
jgi:large subunit ribosomal protein L18